MVSLLGTCHKILHCPIRATALALVLAVLLSPAGDVSAQQTVGPQDVVTQNVRQLATLKLHRPGGARLAAIGRQRGAQAVLASLWDVNDDSTGRLMADFLSALDRYKRDFEGPGIA